MIGILAGLKWHLGGENFFKIVCATNNNFQDFYIYSHRCCFFILVSLFILEKSVYIVIGGQIGKEKYQIWDSLKLSFTLFKS